MANDYRKQGSSGGRVGYDPDKAERGERAKMALSKGESLPATFNRSSSIPASGATRQVPLPKPQATGKPVQPASAVKASSSSPVGPHGTAGIKQEYKKATDEEY